MSARRVRIELTEAQLDEVINCVQAAWREGIAYGMVTRQERALLAAYRRRLLAKLEEAAKP